MTSRHAQPQLITGVNECEVEFQNCCFRGYHERAIKCAGAAGCSHGSCQHSFFANSSDSLRTWRGSSLWSFCRILWIHDIRFQTSQTKPLHSGGKCDPWFLHRCILLKNVQNESTTDSSTGDSGSRGISCASSIRISHRRLPDGYPSSSSLDANGSASIRGSDKCPHLSYDTLSHQYSRNCPAIMRPT